MIKREDVINFVKYCEDNLTLKNAEDICEDLYHNLPLCIMDAVYSMGVRYTSARNVTERYKKYGEAESSESHTVTDFIENVKKEGGCEAFAYNVVKNLQRTATRNGILKSESCCLVAQVLKARGIETISDFMSYCDKAELDKAICSTKSQSSGIMLKYLYMLAGDENMVKPDRMIRRFVKNAGFSKIEDEDIVELFRGTVSELKGSYPDLTPRALDSAIWLYQRKIKAEKKKDRCHSEA